MNGLEQFSFDSEGRVKVFKYEVVKGEFKGKVLNSFYVSTNISDPNFIPCFDEEKEYVIWVNNLKLLGSESLEINKDEIKKRLTQCQERMSIE